MLALGPGGGVTNDPATSLQRFMGSPLGITAVVTAAVGVGSLFAWWGCGCGLYKLNPVLPVGLNAPGYGFNP